MHLVIAVIRALRGATVPMIDRCVLVALADRANASGKCWPSLARIAKDIDASRRGVIASVKRIVAQGLVQAERRPTGGQNGADSTVYSIDADRLVAALRRHGLTGEAGALVHDVHQCTPCTSESGAPGLVNEVHLTGELRAPEDPHGRSPVEDPHPPEGASAPVVEDSIVGDTEFCPPSSPASSSTAKPKRASKGKPPRKISSSLIATPDEHAARCRVLGAYRDGLKAAGRPEPADMTKAAAMVLPFVRRVGADIALSAVEGAFTNTSTRSWATLQRIVADPDRFRGTAPASDKPKHAVQSSEGRAWKPAWANDKVPRVQGNLASLERYEGRKDEFDPMPVAANDPEAPF